MTPEEKLRKMEEEGFISDLSISRKETPEIYIKALKALTNTLSDGDLILLQETMDGDPEDGLFEMITQEVLKRHPELF